MGLSKGRSFESFCSTNLFLIRAEKERKIVSDVRNRHEKDIKENKRFENTFKKTGSQFSGHTAHDHKLTHCNINRPLYNMNRQAHIMV